MRGALNTRNKGCLSRRNNNHDNRTPTSNPSNLGAAVFQGCVRSSPCPNPTNQSKTGVLLLITTPDLIDDPDISKRLESAFSYVGGRAETLFSGVYVREKLPGIIALTIMGGM